MKETLSPRRLKLGAIGILATASLLLSGCASGAESTPEAAAVEEESDLYQAGMIGVSPAGDPTEGGMLRLAAQGEPAVLDPVKNIYSASTGGTEMTAIFDVLMRWDIETGELVPQLAEGLTSNDEGTEWSLDLRDGVSFSDGTALDSAAVKWSIERYIENKGTEHALLTRNLSDIATPDSDTVVFTTNTPWTTFGNMLASGPGLIVAEASDADTEFKPVGAGPFTLKKHAPQESLNLERNDAYWGDKALLDSLEFVYLNDQTASLDSLESGSVQATLLSQPNVVQDAVEAGLSGYMNIVSISNVSLINAAEDRPGADPRVRQALQLGVDTDLIRQRAFEGAGGTDTDVFSQYSVWFNEAEPLAFDPVKAKELVAEAVADGFDGKIVYTTGQDPSSRALALAVKASLDSVGFEVEIETLRSTQDIITRIAVERDYDVAGWGISLRDSDPYSRMFAALHSEGTLTHGVATSPEMDAIIEEFPAATTDDERKEILSRLQTQWNIDVPAIVFSPKAEFWAWNNAQLQGVEGSATSVLILDKAWLAK